MKNKISLLSFIAVFLYCINLTAQNYSGGSGTETDPYLISSNADMQALAYATDYVYDYSKDKHFLLTQDLTDFTDVIGRGTINASPFQGIFDGNGHSIEININSTYDSYPYFGIFGKTEGATIKNMKVLGSITFAENNGYTVYMGGICGYASATTFINCYNSATISASGYAHNLVNSAGICGFATNSKIIDCHNNGNISAHGTGYNSAYSGGICGFASETEINHCYNIGGINSTVSNRSNSSNKSYSGGISGVLSNSSLSNCYNTANIFSSGYRSNPYIIEVGCYSGGIVALNEESTISNCYNTGNCITNNFLFPGFFSVVGYAGGISGYSNINSNLKNNFVVCEKIDGSWRASDPEYTGRINGNYLGNFLNCYSLATTFVNNEIVTTSDATDKNGANADIISLQMQSWITTNLGWDFTDTWYMPNTPGYPLLKRKPNICISKSAITYGDIAEILSDNTNTPIKYSVSDNSIIKIEENIVTPLKAGSVTIKATQTGLNEFMSDTITITLQINKKEVKAKVNDCDMTYGDTPSFTCTYDGFINDETEAVLTTLPTFACNATSTSNTGSYLIVPSGAIADNYNFIYENGTLTVGKRPLIVSPNNAERIYFLMNIIQNMEFI